jgi:protoporphyrinogen/coproporphyrinogen III oxidase
MKVAVIGGGIAGVSTAYELVRAGAEFTLYEASQRLGGIVETVHRDGFVVECGPDSWVTEKPWARELAIELGLEDEIIPSNDQWRKMYIAQGGQLVPMPDGLRMMVPTKWEPLLSAPLFSEQARLAYLREPERAEQLKLAAPETDESVADFVRRHFGDEVTKTIAGPLLAGIFGGSIDTLSVRAVMPAFVKMEREHGSLIVALQKSTRNAPSASVFTTLKPGLQALIDRMVATLPASSLRMQKAITAISQDRDGRWQVQSSSGVEGFDAVVVATPADATRKLLSPLHPDFNELLSMDASSAIVVALAFAGDQASRMRIPRGFGFLVPQTMDKEQEPSLLACTFVDQKFAHRVPDGSLLLRGFIGGRSAPLLLDAPDHEILSYATRQLSLLLGQLPEPSFTVIRRWPRSLPQYAVGHLERLEQLEKQVREFPGLALVGNAYYGVGLPDLVRQGRETAQRLVSVSPCT